MRDLTQEVQAIELNRTVVASPLQAGLGATPEPQYQIIFKAAFEFLPKFFDGKNIPVSRFFGDSIYALEEQLQHLKNIFTEHRNMSQLNSLLATVAQMKLFKIMVIESAIFRKILLN